LETITTMNTHPTASAGLNTAFHKLLGAGLGVWLLAQVALIAAGRWAGGQSTWLGALDWAVGHSWVAFLVGLVALFAFSVRFPGALGRALVAYVLPLGVFVVLGGIFYAVYPDRWFLSEMLGFLPLVWLFGVFGWFWLRLKPEAHANEALTRTLLPPLIGGIAVLLGVAVPTFRGNAFLYRNAFSLSLEKAAFADGKLAADAVLEIHKPGDYRFRAMRYSYMDMMAVQDPEVDTQTGRIEWTGAGSPAADATGAFPLTIRWDKSPPPAPTTDEGMDEDSIVLEVSTSAEPDTVVHSLSVPLTAN
jgi:hypothetical protein